MNISKKIILVPDNKKLQPIPVHVYPDVSGNVNSKAGPNFQNSPTLNGSATTYTEETRPSNATAQSQTNSNFWPGFFWPIIFGAIFIIAIILFYWIALTKE